MYSLRVLKYFDLIGDPLNAEGRGIFSFDFKVTSHLVQDKRYWHFVEAETCKDFIYRIERNILNIVATTLCLNKLHHPPLGSSYTVVSVGKANTSLTASGFKTIEKNVHKTVFHQVRNKEKRTRCDTTWIDMTGFTPACMASG